MVHVEETLVPSEVFYVFAAGTLNESRLLKGAQFSQVAPVGTTFGRDVPEPQGEVIAALARILDEGGSISPVIWLWIEEP